MKIHGEGYASGKYSSARRDLESEEEPPAPTTSTAPPTDVDTDSKPDLLSQTTSSAVEVAAAVKSAVILRTKVLLESDSV